MTIADPTTFKLTFEISNTEREKLSALASKNNFETIEKFLVWYALSKVSDYDSTKYDSSEVVELARSTTETAGEYLTSSEAPAVKKKG